MVPRSSAVCSVSKSVNRIEIRADHSRMVKFRSQSDEHYQRVILNIKEITKAYECAAQERLQIAITEEELEKLVKWISPIEPQKRHRDMVLKRLDGTGGWFTQLQSFKDWRGSGNSEEHVDSSGSSSTQVFGCYGKPGAGKSVIW
jgi:hypothetical protein